MSDASQKLLAPGDRLRDYRIEAKIGEGGMGAVYRAVHTRLDKTVALKVLPESRTLSGDSVARFQREMKAVGKLDHPNIVGATDAGDEDGVHFLAMELVDGLDLATILRRRGKLPVPEACELIGQAAIGLSHAAEHGLVHRDIKPANLLVTRDGIVKILDLGLALLHGDDLTATNQVMGTLDYMAPEQIAHFHEVDIRADLYSLGCTLYKLLAGVAPFHEHKTPIQKIHAHTDVAPPPITAFRSDLPPQLVDLTERLLSKDPNGRPATPDELVEALEPLAAGSDLQSLVTLVEAGAEEPTEPLPQQSTPEPAAAEPQPAGVPADATRAMTAGVTELAGPRPETPAPRNRLLVAGAAAIVVLLLIVAWLMNRDEATAESPPDNSKTPATDWIDLAARVDVDQDAVAGQWRRADGALVSDRSAWARIELPYRPPDEYDFRVEFSTAADDEQSRGEIFQVFTVAGRDVRWSMWCLDYRQFAFVWDQQVFNLDNPTRRQQPALEPARRYRARIEVRRHAVTAFLDDELVSQWTPVRGAPNQLDQRLNDRTLLGLGAYESRVRIHRVEVREVTGEGELTR